MSAPKILLIDIETKPAMVYSFGIRDQYLTHKQIAQDGGVICVGWKWAGSKKTAVLSEWEHGYSEMIRKTHSLLSEADAVASYNGASFDLPRLQGCFLLEGLPPPPPPTQIDIYKTVRKLGFICNKLDYIAPLLGLGSKVKHEGLEMWIKVMEGCPKAQAKMAKYCAGDVRLLEDVYDRVAPYVMNHPRLRNTPPGACGHCGSGSVQRRGYNRSKAFRTERIQCNECGSWSTGKREKIAA